MPNFMLLATAWGPQFGGINSFNMDFAAGLAAHLGQSGKVFCATFQPSLEDMEDARSKNVVLIHIDRPRTSPAYDKSWSSDVWQEFSKKYSNEAIDWWVGHDVITGCAAVEGPRIAQGGRSTLIMHMSYADYQGFKGGIGQRAQKMEDEQRALFKRADWCFANGPLLRDALKDMVSGVSMLIPGFANVPRQPSGRLNLITFGRMDRESDRIKQGALAVAGFASAVRLAHAQVGLPESLKSNPQMRIIGIKEPDGEEEHALARLASERAGREINVVPLPYDESRNDLFDKLGRANIALMLSWHEGFGLTGWEAIAGEVPLILSQQTGLWHLLKETFGEGAARGYVRTIDVRGKRGGDATANFLPADEDEVRDAIIECVKHLERDQSVATTLKQELIKKLTCTWEHAAEKFLEGIAAATKKIAVSTRVISTSLPATQVPSSQSDFITIPQSAWPAGLPVEEMPDSLLLRPESRIVRFSTLREPLRDNIIAWALAPDRPIKLRLQAGEGGTGKTRLLIEVCDVLATRYGWRTGFADSSSSGLLALLREGKPCLIVLDYAETRTSEIVEITRAVLKAEHAPHVRLMLLAREGGDWWESLDVAAGSDQVIAAILRGSETKSGPFRMAGESIEETARSTLFAEAFEDFARFKGLAVPPVSPPDLSHDLFKNTLFIHLAALASLRGRSTIDDKELLMTALRHERSYWQKLLIDDCNLDQMLSVIEQAVGLFTLCGAKRSTKDARSLLARVPSVRDLAAEKRHQVFDILRRIYPLDGGVAGLQPDILGESLVGDVLSKDDELIDVVFGGESSAIDSRQALTVLTRLARRSPVEQRWLRIALERHLNKISEDAMHVGMETGSPMPEILTQVIKEAETPERRRAVETLGSKIPTTTNNLSYLSVEVKRQSIAFIEMKKSGKQAKRDAALVREFCALAERLDSNGHFAEAARVSSEGVRYSAAIVSDRDDDQSELGRALLIFSKQFAAVGRFNDALDAAEKSEAVASKLMAKRPTPINRANWGATVSALSKILSDVGRFSDALRFAEMGEIETRGLAKAQPEEYNSSWAVTLNNLGNRLEDNGRLEDALHTQERSEAIWSGLAAVRPDLHTAAWVSSLGNLSDGLRLVGRYKDALERAEKAEIIVRELAASQPDTYAVRWASALDRLGLALRDVGRYEVALQAQEASVKIRRKLAERQPDAYSLNLAVGLGNLADAQLNAEKYEVALITAREAISKFGNFVELYPAVYLGYIGFCYRVLADSHFNLGWIHDALGDAYVSAEKWVEVSSLRRNYETTQMVKTFKTLIQVEIECGLRDKAVSTLRQVFDLLRRPLNDNPRPLKGPLLEMMAMIESFDVEAVSRVVPSDLLDIVNGNLGDKDRI